MEQANKKIHFYHLYMKTPIMSEFAAIDWDSGIPCPDLTHATVFMEGDEADGALQQAREMNPYVEFQMRKIPSWRIIQ